MNRSLGIALIVCSFFVSSSAKPAAAQSMTIPLISQERAQQIGLQRAWVTQVPLDRARSKIIHIKFQAGLLLVVTSENMLYVIDPESGQTLWSFLIGDRKLLALSPTADATHIAVANTTRLFVMDRATGSIVMDREVTGTPDRGPVLTAAQVALPIVKGPMEVYPLPIDDRTKPENVLSARYYASAGRLAGDPVASDDLLVWAGDLNRISAHLFGARESDFSKLVPERFSTGPTLFPPKAYVSADFPQRVYVGTELGYVIAYDAQTFAELWRYSAGSPILRRPIALPNAVLVLPEDGGLVAVNPKSGELIWSAPDPVQFVSASPKCIYTLDQFGRLNILDANSGARASTFQLPHSLKLLVNDQNDRLILYTDQGLIQTLHEPALAQPHSNFPPLPASSKKPGATTQPAEAPPAARAAAPAGQGAAAAPFTHFKVP
ncbi:MAG TPA: PQQ-binding-like beta-propeller repeat protein [Pirellulales bacterium]|jgi:hypothetical protein